MDGGALSTGRDCCHTPTSWTGLLSLCVPAPTSALSRVNCSSSPSSSLGLMSSDDILGTN